MTNPSVKVGISYEMEVVVMPGEKSPWPSVKKPDTYEALRDKGMSKERSAKISNAQAGKAKKSGAPRGRKSGTS